MSGLVRFCPSTPARQSGRESPAAQFPNSAPGDDTWAGQGAAPSFSTPAKGSAGPASPGAPSRPGPTTRQPGTLHFSSTAGEHHPVAPQSQAPHLGKGRVQGSPAPPAAPTWQAALPPRGKSLGHRDSRVAHCGSGWALGPRPVAPQSSFRSAHFNFLQSQMSLLRPPPALSSPLTATCPSTHFVGQCLSTSWNPVLSLSVEP